MRSKTVKDFKIAFTLSEILITLGIIGVVAAITINIFIPQYERVTAQIRLKKAYSILNNAYERLKNDEYDSIVTDYSSSGNSCYANQSRCVGEMFGKYLKFIDTAIGIPTSESFKECWNNTDIKDNHEQHYCGISSDGIAYDFDDEAGKVLINIDVNGPKKGPNMIGRDIFVDIVIRNNKIETIDGECYWGRKYTGLSSNRGCAYKLLNNNF